MKRLFWIGVGAAAGASGTVWAQRTVKARVEELGADQAIAVAGRGARAVGRTVVAAVGEGRTAMADREVELRRRILGEDSVLDLRPPEVVPRHRPVGPRRSARPTRPRGSAVSLRAPRR